MENLTSILSVFIVDIPIVLVWLIGIILAIVFWNQHPRVSLLSLIALIGLMILTLVGTFLNVWLPMNLDKSGWTVTQMGIRLGIFGFISSLLSAGFWGLLLAAIFGWRKNNLPRL
jgi:hypothetical protein